MQWIGTYKYYSENQNWFARWNCILYYSVVLLEPSVAKKRGLAGDTETEEDLTPLRKRVSFFLTSSFCFFFNVFYWWRQRPNPENRKLKRETSIIFFSILYYLTEITVNSHFVNAVNQWPARKITVYAAYVHASPKRNFKMLGLMDFQIPMGSSLNILSLLFSTCRLLDSLLQKEENVNRMKLAPLLRPLKTER